MAHTSALIDAAVEGEKFIAVPLFDGTAADGAQDSFVTFQNWRPADADPSVAWTALAKLAHGRVHIAFFNQGATTQTPDYQIGMRYFANGVSDQLEMNFGDFTLDGKMTQFELSSPGHC
jgi:hypothetical protein